MKFIADVMLGRLAKRMRLLGYDVLYGSGLDDNEIIRLSLEEYRIILTRDTGLVKRPLAARHFFIHEDKVEEQLSRVLSAFPIEEKILPLTRCSHCNQLLTNIDKSDVKELVPEYVYQRQTVFMKCRSCGRIFWKGSHVERMGLKEAKKKPV